MKLFNFFRNRVKDSTKQAIPIKEIIESKGLGWIVECIEVKDEYPRVNWNKIASRFESDNQDEFENDIIDNISRIWLNQLALNFNERECLNKFIVHESDNFILLTSESDKYVRLFLAFLERARNTILRTLDGIAQTNQVGKFVVVIAEDIDSYYSYISHYYPDEGQFAASSGVFLSGGHGHFVFPHQELNLSESVAAHELTHAMLAHLQIPLWLDEGLAVNMENAITRFPQFRLNKEKHIKHQQFWNEIEIQEFWSGSSFRRPDEAVTLSYQLGQLIVLSLSEDYAAFVEFVNKANYSDGGDRAAVEVYGGSIGAVIHQFFGDGKWTPEPSLWNK